MKLQLLAVGVLSGLVAFSPLFSSAGPLDNWHRRDTGASNSISALTFGDGEFVAFEAPGPSAILNSSDGAQWSRRLTSADIFALSLARGGQRYLLVNQLGFVGTSSNGVDWTLKTDAPGGAASVQFIGETAYAVGSAGPIFCGFEPCPSIAPVIWSIPAQGDWPSTILPGEGPVSRADLAAGGSVRVAIGRVDGPNGLPLVGNPKGLVIWQSTGGGYREVARMNEPFRPYPLPVGVAYGNGMFVAVMSLSIILYSRDGQHWQSAPVPGEAALQDVAFGAGQFVAVGSGGTIVTSRDGMAWETRSSGTDAPLTQVAFGNYTFVVVGAPNLVLQSDPLVSLAIRRNPGIELQISGPAAGNYRIETSLKPIGEAWQVLTNIVPVTSPFTYAPPIAPGVSEAYYRVALTR